MIYPSGDQPFFRIQLLRFLNRINMTELLLLSQELTEMKKARNILGFRSQTDLKTGRNPNISHLKL